MKKSRWVWMPHAAHFILGYRCQFVLATYVGKYIVSTVGELLNFEKGNDKFETIGYNRLYETMVFEAHKSDLDCCHYVIDVSKEVDMKGYNDAKSAYNGHMKLCNKWSKRK